MLEGTRRCRLALRSAHRSVDACQIALLKHSSAPKGALHRFFLRNSTLARTPAKHPTKRLGGRPATSTERRNSLEASTCCPTSGLQPWILTLVSTGETVALTMLNATAENATGRRRRRRRPQSRSLKRIDRRQSHPVGRTEILNVHVANRRNVRQPIAEHRRSQSSRTSWAAGFGGIRKAGVMQFTVTGIESRLSTAIMPIHSWPDRFKSAVAGMTQPGKRHGPRPRCDDGGFVVLGEPDESATVTGTLVGAPVRGS